MIQEAFEEILEIPRPVIIKTISFALVVLLAIFLWGNSRINPVRKNLTRIKGEANSKLVGDLKGLDTKKLESFKNKIKKDTGVYKKVLIRDFFISEKLAVLPELLPEGVWLEQIYFDKGRKNIVLKGIVYRKDDKETSDAPYAFIDNLKSSPLFSNAVTSVSVKSLRIAFQKEYKVGKFDVEVRLAI